MAFKFTQTGAEIQEILDNAASQSYVQNAIYSAIITDTASGATISITDGADAPVKALSIVVNPVQAGSGTPTPDNVRPISGWTEAEITRESGNLYNSATNTDGYYYNDSLEWTENAVVTCTDYIKLTGDKVKVTLSLAPGGAGIRVNYFDESKTILSQDKTTVTSGVYTYSYTPPTNAVYIRVSVNKTVSPLSMIKCEKAYTVELNGTMYGGTVDVVGGTKENTMAIIDLGALTWTTNALPLTVATSTQGIIQPPPSNDDVADIYCSAYTPSSRSGIANNCIAIAQNGSVVIDNNNFVGMTADQIKAALSGVKLVYTLVTPTSGTITPVTDISTEYGNNTVYTDTGDTTMEYRCDTKLYIAKVV